VLVLAFIALPILGGEGGFADATLVVDKQQEIVTGKEFFMHSFKIGVPAEKEVGDGRQGSGEDFRDFTVIGISDMNITLIYIN
jgi:hypothetical protein